MATFDYEGVALVENVATPVTITFSVRQMSRTAGFEVLRKFDALAPLFTNLPDLLHEGDWLLVERAPVEIRIGGDVFTSGERTVTAKDGSVLKFVLPITREAFHDLPMDLTEAWIQAASVANPFYLGAIKKAVGLTSTPTITVPRSGNESLIVSTPPPPATPTTG